MEIQKTLTGMSLEQKLKFLTSADAWHTVGFENPKVPQVAVSDGPSGLRKVLKDSGGVCEQIKTVCFPSASAAASSWNPDLAVREGYALAGECIRNGVNILLGPGVNMKRSPLCGRNFEYYSEDPVLAGKMGAAFVNGIQERGVGACLKHFAGNDQEADRLFGSSEIDERTLREIYLKAFETVVKEAKPWSVMCAYNRLNGVFCSQNPWLLDEVLRKEWGFDGVVLSDWSAVHDRPAALRASLEAEFPFSAESYPALQKAYQAGEITDRQIDRAVKSLLKFVDRASTAQKQWKAPADAKKEELAAAKELAEESITLLKNKDGILPIDEKRVGKIAVIGGCAEVPFIQGGGSAEVTPSVTEAPLDEIRRMAKGKTEYFPAYTWTSGHAAPTMIQYREALGIAAASDVALVFVGEPALSEREGEDRSSIRLNPLLEQLIRDVAHINPNTVVVVQAGSAIDMSPWIDSVKGVVMNWYAGSCCGSAVAEVLFGRVNPSGKLSESFPLCLEDTPAYGNYPGLPIARYNEGGLIGYRYYDTARKEVLFPFGFGLSYTTFAYSGLTVSSDKLTKGSPLKVSFRVRNTGKRAGKEIVQLYVGSFSSAVVRPDKELKRFAKVDLKPGEEKEVSFTLTWEDFTYFSTVYHKWTLESGCYRILVGASSRDIRLQSSVTA